MAKKYDVIIVGGGPSGIFAALELCQATDLNILLVEKGKDIDKRSSLVCGLGGAGAFSDGKLTLAPQVGGRLRDYLGEADTEALIKYVDNIYLKFGAPKKLYGTGDKVDDIRHQASLIELRLTPVPIRHLGTERCRSVLKAMRDYLTPGLEFKLETMAATVVVDNGEVKGIETETGERFDCRYLIVAPGREGADWLSKEAKRLNLTTHNNPVDVGIRVEVPVAVLEDLVSVLYEAKLEYLSKSFDDRIRTFCMCPAGEVTTETTGGCDPVITVNGHSYAKRKSNNNGHRSTPVRIERGLVQPTLKSATPGDLSFVLPYRHLTGLIEMLQAMDKLAPGVASSHTLLYGVEVKFYSCQLQLSPCLETEVSNMFATGDGAGVSRGLIQASASGVVAAREILRRSRH
jgi:uncharacterized FAD-dependent dehydrogenase